MGRADPGPQHGVTPASCSPVPLLGRFPFVQVQVPHGAGQGRLSLLTQGLALPVLFPLQDLLIESPRSQIQGFVLGLSCLLPRG